MKKALVCGGGGFIGAHLVKRLKSRGSWVRAVDLKRPPYAPTHADDFVLGDLRSLQVCRQVVEGDFDEVYQLAADMGGAGYVFTGQNDADIMHNSALINLNMLESCAGVGCGRIFYSSSACVYPEYNQRDPGDPKTSEDSAYPAQPDSEYGWEKLFSERLYLAFRRNRGLDVRVARLHNVFGPEGSWRDGREKAPAALCRKVAEAPEGQSIEIWGDGEQTRSFLYIEDFLDAAERLMASDLVGPVNIGSQEMVTIKELAGIVMRIAGKSLRIDHVPGPLGVRGRTSDNRLIESALGWRPRYSLAAGLEPTYRWIADLVARAATG